MDPVTLGGGMGLSYPDSVDSSPRSRGGESWDEPFPSSAAAAAASSKLRLMCSYGGRIVPRPTDKSLCYLGGETRIVVVDRHLSLSDLSSKLSRSLLNNRPFTLKYQLPSEDLDSLISVTTDEDLDNMIEEYDRIAAAAAASSQSDKGSAKSSRIRLFLFPSNPDSAPSSIGSLLDDSKSETWFVDALNGAMSIGIDGLPRGSTDSASVNCLLGLEDDSSVHSRAGIGGGPNIGGGAQPDADQMSLSRPDSSAKLGRQGQDVHSVPDSPMLDTSSSFGSTSSAPCLSNLHPIRVRPDERPTDQRYANLDDHFQQMNISSAASAPPSVPPQQIPLASSAAAASSTPTENPNRVFGSDDDKSDTHKQMPVPPQAANQQRPAPIEAPIQDSRPVYYQERMPAAAPPPPVNPVGEPKREFSMIDPAATYRMQQVHQVPESGYLMPTMTVPEQLYPLAHPHLQHQQQQQQQLQQQQLQQQQFIPANPRFLHQVPSYYQVPHHMQQSQQYDPSIPMYYLPVHQNPQPQAVPMPKITPKPEIQPSMYRTAAPPPANMIHMATTAAAPDQGHAVYSGMSYQLMQQHHQHPSQAQASAAPAPQLVGYGYEYANQTDTSMHPQVYYTHTTSPPSMPAQYQTMMSDAQNQQAAQYQAMITDAQNQQAAEVKQNRAS